jgi:SSS family solute:Na+ symporter
MIVSKLSLPQNQEQLRLVTFEKSELNLKFKFSTDTVLTLILIAMVLLLWVIFSPLGIAK